MGWFDILEAKTTASVMDTLEEAVWEESPFTKLLVLELS